MSNTSSTNLTSASEKAKVEKPLAINKYSVHEMKSAIDTKIIEYLEENKFVESHFLSNLKILVGLFCLSFTALAYLYPYFYPKPLPEIYNIVLFSVIM